MDRRVTRALDGDLVGDRSHPHSCDVALAAGGACHSTGVLTTREAAAPYAHPVNILLMGGFIIALALERWNLHARIALHVVARAGGKPRLMILGFMVAAALLSMWISNTATTLDADPHRVVGRPG